MNGKTGSTSRSAWNEGHVAAFESFHPLGTMPRLAFDLALYTAQQRSDLRPMGMHDIADGRIRVREYRSGIIRMIPLHPRLQESIAATFDGQPVFITTERGKPFKSDESFGLWFSRKCEDAGLKGFGIRGIRNVSSIRLLETGLSVKMVEGLTGLPIERPSRTEAGRPADIILPAKPRLPSHLQAKPAAAIHNAARPAEESHPIAMRDHLFDQLASIREDLSHEEAEKIYQIILAMRPSSN